MAAEEGAMTESPPPDSVPGDEMAAQEAEVGYVLPDGYDLPPKYDPRADGLSLAAVVVAGVAALGFFVAMLMAVPNPLAGEEAQVLIKRGAALHEQAARGVPLGEGAGTGLASQVDALGGYSGSGVGRASVVEVSERHLGLAQGSITGEAAVEGHELSRHGVHCFCDVGRVAEVLYFHCCGQLATAVMVPHDDGLLERLKAVAEQQPSGAALQVYSGKGTIVLIYGSHDFSGLARHLGAS